MVAEPVVVAAAVPPLDTLAARIQAIGLAPQRLHQAKHRPSVPEVPPPSEQERQCHHTQTAGYSPRRRRRMTPPIAALRLGIRTLATAAAPPSCHSRPPTPQRAPPAPPRRCIRASSSEQGRLVEALHCSTTPTTASPRLPYQRHQGRHNLHRRPYLLHRRSRPPRPPTSSAVWQPWTEGRGSGSAHGTPRRWGSPPASKCRREGRHSRGRAKEQKGGGAAMVTATSAAVHTGDTRRGRRPPAAAQIGGSISRSSLSWAAATRSWPCPSCAC